MRGYLYILQTKNKHYYIGSTNNLDRRITEHNLGKTKSLKNLLPVVLVFNQEYTDVKIARRIEIKLKRFKNKKIIERIIRDKHIKLV